MTSPTVSASRNSPQPDGHWQPDASKFGATSAEEVLEARRRAKPDGRGVSGTSCNDKLQHDPKLTVRGLIEQSNVAMVGTTDDPIDSL